MKFRKFEGGSWSVFLTDFEGEVVDQVFHGMFFWGGGNFVFFWGANLVIFLGGGIFIFWGGKLHHCK